MARVKGGGDQGYKLDVPCIPDSTFEGELDALIAAGTDIEGKLVTLTFSNNYEVTSAAESAIPDGIIRNYHKAGSSYTLDVQLFHYTDQNSASHTPVCIVNFPMVETLSLQDSVLVNTTTYVGVKDGGTGGWGACIAKDVPTTDYVDIIF